MKLVIERDSLGVHFRSPLVKQARLLAWIVTLFVGTMGIGLFIDTNQHPGSYPFILAAICVSMFVRYDGHYSITRDHIIATHRFAGRDFTKAYPLSNYRAIEINLGFSRRKPFIIKKYYFVVFLHRYGTRLLGDHFSFVGILTTLNLQPRETFCQLIKELSSLTGLPIILASACPEGFCEFQEHVK